MKSELWANATDIDQWANRREAQETLPKLLRRLISATLPDLTALGFRANEGVQLSGWDGTVQATNATAFVPAGTCSLHYLRPLSSPLGLDLHISSEAECLLAFRSRSLSMNRGLL